MDAERRSHSRTRATKFLVAGALALVANAPARAADDDAGKESSKESSSHEKSAAFATKAELNKLQAEVREQRQLIIQMLQNEQQRYEMLLRLIQGQAGAGGELAPAGESPAAPAAAGASAEPAESPSEAAPSRPASTKIARAAVERRTGFVEGKVTVTGADASDIYIYLDGVRSAPVRGKSIEIRQEGKQFRPRVAVVQAGTSVSFPNFDKIYHNVFSTSPHNSFDLGSYSADDKPRQVTLASPGVVEVFCNMHQKMNANILVLPNGVFTKVRPDGTFRLENLPVGQRWLTAWGPQAKPSRRRVEVTQSGAQVSFVLEREEQRAHTNKLGQAYGSYRE
jgi:plastocyanin